MKKKNIMIIAISAIVIIVLAIIAVVGYNFYDKNRSKSITKVGGVITDAKEETNIFTGHPKPTKPNVGNTYFVKDYLGRNADTTCTYRLNGECMDDYGKSHVYIRFDSTSGEKVEKASISNYKVISQNINYGDELIVTEGEYGVSNPSITEIFLKVEKIDKNKKLIEVEKKGQLPRYECQSKNNGVVGAFVKKHDTLTSNNFNTVECSWTEKVLK